jgi:predicted DNA-binding transcriptional regulator AlpA
LADYLTTPEFCEKYHVSPRTADRWRVTGEGPRWVRTGPRKVLYRVVDCELWAASRTFDHRADELSRAAAAPTEAA